MRNKTTVQKTRDETITESITCDICKKTYRGENWESEGYSVLETEVRMRTGTSYPEMSSGQETSFDICPTCFVERLIPAMAVFGAIPTVEDWDY